MAYSLETRTPFLDFRLIEYMAHVHKDIKMHNFERKTILRNTIGQKLPISLLKAPKRGFSVPLREWFKGDSFKESLSYMGESMPFLNNEIIRMNNSSERDFGNFIWILFVLNKIVNSR